VTARNEFEKLLRALHVLETTGDDNGSEGDSLRDAMEPLWDAMTEEGRVEMRSLSASLREEPKTDAGRAVSEFLKAPVSLASSPRGLGNKKPSAFEIANTCNACGQQMERGAVMVCHECAGKRVLHPTPLKIGETIRWKKDDSPVLEKPESVAPIDQRMTVMIKRLLDALHATHSPPWTLDNCPSCRKVLAP
jgi:hypothetical protein